VPTLPIIQAPHVTPCAAAHCDEPFISITQAPHLKSSGGKELCSGALFHQGVPCARCALTVVAAQDIGMWAPDGNERIDRSVYWPVQRPR
jgi:hypothetical protein